MSETWRPVPGHEGVYEVSDHGRVRSFQRSEDPRVLRPGRMNRFGHVSVALGQRNSRTVHSLVLEAFVGPRPHGYDVAHINGDGSDNRLENLRYATRSENNIDATMHGRRKYDAAAVALAKDLTVSTAVVRKVTGMCLTHIYNIRKGSVRVNA